MTKKLEERDNCYHCFAIESVERLAPISRVRLVILRVFLSCLFTGLEALDDAGAIREYTPHKESLNTFGRSQYERQLFSEKGL